MNIIKIKEQNLKWILNKEWNWKNLLITKRKIQQAKNSQHSLEKKIICLVQNTKSLLSSSLTLSNIYIMFEYVRILK